MIHRPRTLAVAAVALAIAALTGCTARPGTAPDPGTTARPASAVHFACPSATEVAALTAVPFTAASGTATCTYATAADTDVQARITVTHPAASAGSTLSGARDAAIRRGEKTADLSRLTFDSFTAATGSTCTAWFPAEDGVLTSVAARRSGASGAGSCADAASVAALIGAGTPKDAAPTVALLASTRLAGTTTESAAWPWRIATRADVRIDRQVAAGYLHPSAQGSFASVAATVPADARAVVLVSGTAEAGESRLEVLTATTAALSAASARASKATIIVVGPVTGAAATDADRALAGDLRTAAGIAGARYLDPADLLTAEGTAGLADGIAAQLRQAGIGSH